MKRRAMAMAVIMAVAFAATVQAGSFVGTVRVGLNATHTDTSETVPTGGAAASEKFTDWVVNQTFTAGTNANQANMFFPKTYTTTNTAATTIDINGATADTFGVSVAISEARFVLVSADSGNSNAVQMSWSPFVDEWVDIRPGGTVVFFAPDATAYPSTNATADSIVITNTSGASATYSVLVGGSN